MASPGLKSYIYKFTFTSYKSLQKQLVNDFTHVLCHVRTRQSWVHLKHTGGVCPVTCDGLQVRHWRSRTFVLDISAVSDVMSDRRRDTVLPRGEPLWVGALSTSQDLHFLHKTLVQRGAHTENQRVQTENLGTSGCLFGCNSIIRLWSITTSGSLVSFLLSCTCLR